MKLELDHPLPKGRPREFCVEQALAAALRIFWQRGYEGASMAELTTAMGITKPSLYAAFGNKEALFRKALDLYEREKTAYIGPALAEPSSRRVAERLLNGALAMQTNAMDPKGCLGVISSVACSQAAASVRECVIERQRSSLDAIVDRFDRARQEGDLPPDTNPEGLARYLIAILQGLTVQAGMGATEAELKGLVDTALRTWPGR